MYILNSWGCQLLVIAKMPGTSGTVRGSRKLVEYPSIMNRIELEYLHTSASSICPKIPFLIL